jgi:hypothetical protein
VHGEVLLTGLERHALGDGPGGKRTVALQAEVVVQPARVVALDDEDGLFPLFRAAAIEGLRRLLRIPFPPILLEAHWGNFAYARV